MIWAGWVGVVLGNVFSFGGRSVVGDTDQEFGVMFIVRKYRVVVIVVNGSLVWLFMDGRDGNHGAILCR